jgi:ribose transport system substrate-binding protein
MNERESVVIISDIHIGTTSSTVWYRKEIHEKYLITLFNDIINYANQIEEIILLGDIFEFWTYPPDELPPTIDDIIETHPNILGPNGKLCQALSVLKGRIVFIPGDHDMNVTQSDLNHIKSTEGYTMKFHSGAYIPTYDTHIKFTHGHEYTLLNAPYFVSKLAPLPIGYFVARAIAYKVQSIIKKTPELTIANIDGYEAYSLNEFLSKLPYFIKNYVYGLDVISRYIDEIADLTGMSKDLQIKVNKSIAVTLNELKKIYIYEDFNRTSLPGYENYNIFENYINIVMTGHKHSPSITFNNDKIYYVNTGFMCPTNINLTTPITYGIYNLSNRNVNIVSSEVKYTPPKKVIYLKNAVSMNDLKDITSKIEIKQITTSPANQFTFGWSVFDASLEFWIEMQMGVFSKAEELGIDVIANDEKSNTIEMITGSIDLISKNIDALIIAPYNPKGVPFIVANAKEYEIPVVVIDTGTEGADVAAFIVSDNFGGGIFAGEYALILIKKYSIKSNNIAIIKVQKTAPYALLRGEGFKSVMLAEGYTVVAEETANSLQSEGYEVMKNILASYANNLAVVFSENGTMALGAAQAIDEAGKKGIIMLIGFDATPSVMTAIKSGFMQGTIAQQPFRMGEIGVETANSVLLGIPVIYDDPTNKIILIEVFLVDEYGQIKKEII